MKTPTKRRGLRARAPLFLSVSAALWAAGCSDDSHPNNGTTTPHDAGAASDATVGLDATADAGMVSGDAGGSEDASAHDAGEHDAGAVDSGVAHGEPITAPAGQWTWIDFPNAFCDDGSTTGIGVNLSSSSQNVLIFMNGGGACWDYLTCFQLHTAAQGPIGRSQFEHMADQLDIGPFDRQATGNLFKDWSFVFVPYCTGDVHGGNNVATYGGGGQARQYHHTGHANVLAYFERLSATFPSPPKIVLSGSSAGGFGVLFNYAALRSYWPTGQAYLIDDSGPALPGDYIPASERTSWYATWHIGEVLDDLCGTECQGDLSLGYTALAMHYPDDRMALLSSTQDQVIRQYFLNEAADRFEQGLDELATNVLDPLPNFKYFYITGQSHTMLGSPDNYSSNGTTLTTWLQRMVSDDQAWDSTKP